MKYIFKKITSFKQFFSYSVTYCMFISMTCFSADHRDCVAASRTRCGRRRNAPIRQYCGRSGPCRGRMPATNGRVHRQTARAEDSGRLAIGWTPASTSRVLMLIYN